jgi:hypothetical protein
MVRRILCCLLLAAALSQAWAVSDMGATMAAQSASQSDCAGHSNDGDDVPDCCAGSALADAGCESFCGASAAVARVAIQPPVSHGAAPLELLPAPRPGPRYIPLNPPPIA